MKVTVGDIEVTNENIQVASGHMEVTNGNLEVTVGHFRIGRSSSAPNPDQNA